MNNGSRFRIFIIKLHSSSFTIQNVLNLKLFINFKQSRT